jgi:hypothetical protein
MEGLPPLPPPSIPLPSIPATYIMLTCMPVPRGCVFQIQDKSTLCSPSPSNRERLIIPREGWRGPLVWTFDIKEALFLGLILKAIDKGMWADSGYKK